MEANIYILITLLLKLIVLFNFFLIENLKLFNNCFNSQRKIKRNVIQKYSNAYVYWLSYPNKYNIDLILPHWQNKKNPRQKILKKNTFWIQYKLTHVRFFLLFILVSYLVYVQIYHLHVHVINALIWNQTRI